MENVSLSVPPEDPADIYIPTIQADQEQPHSPSSACSSAAEQAVQLPTIRYTPSSAGVPPPLVAAGARTAIVAAETPAFFQYRTTHTTFCTQVHFAAQAFSYPPTPPLDGPCSAEPERGQEHLAITQGPSGLDYPADNHHTATSINPFPSLPTPPDIEAIHHQQQQQQQQNSAHGGPPPLASDGDGSSSPLTTTSPHSLKQNGVMDVGAGSPQWPASSVCFVPPPQASVSPQMFQFNPRRTSPSALQPAIYYPAAAVSMQQPSAAMGQLSGQLHQQRAMPPLVKGLDGKLSVGSVICGMAMKNMTCLKEVYHI